MSLHQPETLTNIMPVMPKEEEVTTSEPQQKMPKVNTDRPWYTDYGISENGEDRYEAMVKFINECAEWAHVEDEHLRKELKLYTYQVNMYGPYEVDVFPDWPLFSKVHPIDFEGDKEFVEVVKTGTKSAIALYNREHSLDENISLVKIVKVNLICGYGRRFYITFDADVSMSGLRKTYQAEVLNIGDYIDAMMCHIKP
ncbi:unnamed protein product [Cuscuta epithymum]|uniref:Uncharacterized protein n=1 Tax=Cuscuta epithymum TaxID=186058 RepID=A0AAV0FZT6_9ASTE|nr:unnamed protein product [Cuscuta epithymum]